MKYYMAVTADEYELPVCVCKNVTELSKRYEMTEKTIYSYLSRGTVRKKEGVKFIRVITEEQ